MIATLTVKKEDPWSGYKVYENCKQAVAPYLMRSGVRYTGLNGLQYDEDRERLEKELGIESLKPHSSFWDDFAIFVTNKDVVLDTSIPEQELKFKFAKNHKDVAFGLNDKKPGTRYILLQAEEEAKERNTKSRVKRRAIKEFDKMTPTEIRKALRLFGHNSSNVSQEVAENTLDRLVEEDPQRFLTVWVDNKSKDTQFLIEEACAKGILRKQKSTYKYGSDVLGYNLEQTVDHLDNPVNADLKVTILAQLEGKDLSYGEKKPTKEGANSQFSKIKKEIDTEETSEVKEEPKKKSKN
jgi:hypothetical protein